MGPRLEVTVELCDGVEMVGDLLAGDSIRLLLCGSGARFLIFRHPGGLLAPRHLAPRRTTVVRLEVRVQIRALLTDLPARKDLFYHCSVPYSIK